MSNTLTEVILLNTPLDRNYQHTLYFNNPTEQETTFKAFKVKSQENCTYQRKDKIIRFDACIDEIISCDYVMYRNNAHSTKWYYAFITKMEYKNDEMTEIHIETDVIQTWLFSYTMRTSFVEREHVEVDGYGFHTVPENVELGGYICNKHTQANIAPQDDLKIVVGVTKDKDGNNVTGTIYNNIYSGVRYYIFSNTTAGANALNSFITSYGEEGANEAITCMFLAPSQMFDDEKEGSMLSSNFSTNPLYINFNDLEGSTSIDITTKKLDGYTPHNRKLMGYPFRYLLASNNAGASVVYEYEQFKYQDGIVTYNLDQPRFIINSALCPSCSIRMRPLNYKGGEYNDEEGLTGGKFPVLNWTSDTYTNWLTQNGINIGIGVVGGLATVGAGIALTATGAGAGVGLGMIGGGLLSIGSSVGQVVQHSMQPPQAEGNINSGDVTTALGNNDFHFYDMSIKSEYAVIIDQFFDMFGYKINRVKVPAKNHRKHYWYTKTIDANIIGTLPAEDLIKIKECYNRGITFWRNPTNIADYSIAYDNICI